MRTFSNVVLTGASGGFGSALAAAIAPECRAMLLFGRDAARLDNVRKIVEAAGAEVYLSRVPIGDHAEVAAAISDFDSRHPVDLFVANAGVKCGNENGIEPIRQLERIVDVNLTGTIGSVQAVLPFLRARGQGQIAIISSLAAASPQGSLLSYTATKAALSSYGVALRRRCRGSGVDVSVVLPGFIDTPMTDRHHGPTPFVVSSERAALMTLRGLRARQRTIAFPWQLVLLTRLQNLLPAVLSDPVANYFDARIVPDPDQLTAENAASQSDALDLPDDR